MNGDGSIARDEWLGSDAVFDALDPATMDFCHRRTCAELVLHSH